MPYTKTYRAMVPVPLDDPSSNEVLVWLTRESFDRAAAGDALVLSEFNDLGEVAPDQIPPKVEKQLGRPVTDFTWRAFEGVGMRA